MWKKIVPFAIVAGMLSAPAVSFAAPGDAASGEGTSVKQEEKSIKAIEEIIVGTPQLTAKTNAFGQVKLTWLKNIEGTGYMIYRAESKTGTYNLIKTILKPETTEYVDKDVKNHKTYYYQVTPILVEPIESDYEYVKVKTAASQINAAIKVKGAKATIKWNALKNADGYEIYRASSKTEKFRKVAVIKKSDVKTWTDRGLSDREKYYYKVRAYNGTNKTKFSDTQKTGLILTDTWSSGKFAWPVPSAHNISSGFGMRTAPTAGATARHDGIDIGASTGTAVVAVDSGTVIAVTSSSARGIYVDVQHSSGMVSRYQHLSEAKVKIGQSVERGETIALVGSTGVSTGAHLHFELLINSSPVNPMKYFNTSN